MKLIKYFIFSFIVSFFILISNVSADVVTYLSSFPYSSRFNTDNYKFLLSEVLNITSDYHFIFVSDKVDSTYFYLCNKQEGLSSSLWYFISSCNEQIIYDGSSFSLSSSEISDVIFSPGQFKYHLFWTDEEFIFLDKGRKLVINDSTLNKQYFPYGNQDFYFYDNFKYESLFFRALGYYDISSIDTISPTLQVSGSSVYTIEIGSIWNDPGVVCYDNLDSVCNVDIVSNLDINSLGTYTITYSATDSSGNKSESYSRTINVVDTTPPVLSLIGDSVVYLSIDSEYDDLGYNVSDNSKEVIDVFVDVSNLDVSSTGSYYINYLACDSSDNCSSLNRLVKVQSIVPLDFSGSQFLLFDFSSIQDMFPNINFSGLSNSDEFIIVILFNIFFLVFIFVIIWIIIKSLYKMLSLIW